MCIRAQHRPCFWRAYLKLSAEVLASSIALPFTFITLKSFPESWFTSSVKKSVKSYRLLLHQFLRNFFEWVPPIFVNSAALPVSLTVTCYAIKILTCVYHTNDVSILSIQKINLIPIFTLLVSDWAKIEATEAGVALTTLSIQRVPSKIIIDPSQPR
jgi:hypothetical protein